MQQVFNTAAHAEARAWFLQHFEAAAYAELVERYRQGARRHLLAEFSVSSTAGDAGFARAPA